MIRWPGKVPARVVTQEMLCAADWLPTLAGMVGASNLVPKDRPIDGIDASAFMLGKSKTTGRDSYMFFGPDGELMVLGENMFIEKMLPGLTQRRLSEAEMAEYRRPFLEPADVAARIAAYSEWLATSPIPKLFINADPGVFI